jgi:hypothetical protein
MDATLTDRRPRLWTIRVNEKERLAWHRLERTLICGCIRCGDADRGERLDELITVSIARIAKLGDQICER